MSTRGRPRQPLITDAVLEVAREHVLRLGYEGVTIDDIAKAAGASRGAVYRRWPKKGLLIYEALQLRDAPNVPEPSGDIVRDVRAVATANARAYSDPSLRGITTSLSAEVLRDPELAAELRDRFMGPRAEGLRGLLRQAIEAGQLEPDVPVDLFPALLTGPMLYQLVITGEPLAPTQVDELVDVLLRPYLKRRR